MIELTREESLSVLKAFNILEGALMVLGNTNDVIESVDYPIELLIKKLAEENKK